MHKIKFGFAEQSFDAGIHFTSHADPVPNSQWTMFDDRRLGTVSPGERSTFASPNLNIAATISRRHLHGGNSTLLSLATTTMKNDLDVQVYNAHLELMGIATTDTHEPTLQQGAYAADDAFSRLTQLHSRLKRWYAGLPGHLSWNDQTKHSATPSLFLLQ